MSVVLYKNGEAEKFDPFGFKDQLNNGWFLSKKESLNGMRTREGEEQRQGEGQTEQAEEQGKIKFKCKSCGLRKTWPEKDIFVNESGDKFCTEDCKLKG